MCLSNDPEMLRLLNELESNLLQYPEKFSRFIIWVVLTYYGIVIPAGEDKNFILNRIRSINDRRDELKRVYEESKV